MKDAQKKYKDTVFRLLYKDPARALNLYNSIMGTDYSDVEMLQFNTLENAIYMNVKNDLSFIIADRLNIYEQQSTPSANMPLRDLFYVADILQREHMDRSVYSNKPVKIPNPYFVVFYNGKKELPERMELKLSDNYEFPSEDPSLELKVTVLNINPGMNEELKERCPSLKEYMIYVEKVRNYAEIMPLEDAVEQAVDECIKADILREFLSGQKAEVVKMSIYEYDEERELKIIREDERFLGKAEGKAEGIIELLTDYGDVPDELKNRILKQLDMEILKKWIKLAARVKSVEEFSSQMG
ncbi:MAG: hypothetical protein HDR00_01075 [Lachnospiraceae bacterium]|nr:hypothetical protein [Lachnospiraceae bacterium]